MELKWKIFRHDIQEIRRSTKYQQWRQDVRKRDGGACRICGVHLNLHIHHIKPLEKYPDFATEIDNGITLCGNHHALLKGREESTNLQTIIESITNKPDMRTTSQLKQLNDKFCGYLEPLLHNPDTRNKAAFQLLNQLQIYPDSLNQFLPLIRHFLNKENRSDEELAEQIVVEFLKGCSSGAAARVLREYKIWIEAEKHKREAEPEWLKKLRRLAEQQEIVVQWGSLVCSGETYQEKGDYDRAIADFTKAIELNPDYAISYNNRGSINFLTGNYVCAITDLTKAIELNPHDIDGYMKRGFAYWAKGERVRGDIDFIKAKELNPDYTADIYDDIYAKAKQLRE